MFPPLLLNAVNWHYYGSSKNYVCVPFTELKYLPCLAGLSTSYSSTGQKTPIFVFLILFCVLFLVAGVIIGAVFVMTV